MQIIKLTPEENTLNGKINNTDDFVVVLCDAANGSFSINLPDEGTAWRVYVIKKTDSSSNVITIRSKNNTKIDGEFTVSLSSQYDTVSVVSDKSEYFKLWSI